MRQQEGDHRGGEGGEEGAAGPPGLGVSGAHHHHPLPLRHRVSLSTLHQSNKGIALYFPFIAQLTSAVQKSFLFT